MTRPRVVVKWRTIEVPIGSGIELPREILPAFVSHGELTSHLCVSRKSGNKGQQRGRIAPLVWLTVGLPSRGGIEQARENIDGTC